MIEVRHLKKSYPGITPLKDVNATIERGEVISIIGPSGTGKSTFLRCLNLLETPTEGEITFNGQTITDRKCDINALRQKIGMVFQSFKVTTESLKLWVLSGSMKIEHVRISLIRNAIFVKIRVLLKVFSVANSEVISLHKAKTSGLPLFREIGYLAISISR